MKSISNHLKPSDIAAQIRMERQKHNGIFLLMEGSTDYKRFEKFFDHDVCNIINCFGKDNAIGAVDIVQNAGFEDCLAFVDADFDRIIGNHTPDDDIIYSQFHDFDIDICSSEVINRYLSEMAEGKKVNENGGCAAVTSMLLSALRPLSAMRFANLKHKLGYSLTRVDLEVFFDGSTVNVDKMVDHVSYGRMASENHKSALRCLISRYANEDFDIWQFTNGHDFVAALGIALRDRLGNRNPPQTWRSEVEKHLRLAFDVNDFAQIGLMAKVQKWQAARNVGILRK